MIKIRFSFCLLSFNEIMQTERKTYLYYDNSYK